MLPVTHRALTIIATSRSPLHLNNILVSPSLVKNLISVHALTRDNFSVKFDPFGFSVKALSTRTEILRCNSHGKLYPLASPEALARHHALGRLVASASGVTRSPFIFTRSHN
jgi:hypothetical protein